MATHRILGISSLAHALKVSPQLVRKALDRPHKLDRGIGVERARQRAKLKCGSDRERIEMAPVEPKMLPLACDDILGLDEVLINLHLEEPRKSQLVKLRFFGGSTVPQAAQTLGISTSAAENDWAYARAWLKPEMCDGAKDRVKLFNLRASLR